MADALAVEGKEYVSSKRAAELSGYTQDYIGQLSRGGFIDAQRIGGLWYVSMDSLSGYKTRSESEKPQPPQRTPSQDPEAFLSFDGKDYVSAARAAQLTGYHQDYVGQLARSGKILSRQIGNRWYIEREGLLAHKSEKDALLAAVQAESVGISRSVALGRLSGDEEPYFKYLSEAGDMLPSLRAKETGAPLRQAYVAGPARSVRASAAQTVERVQWVSQKGQRVHGKTIFYATTAAVILIIAGGLYGLGRIGHLPKYVTLPNNHLTAAAGVAASRIGDVLEEFVVPELTFHRF